MPLTVAGIMSAKHNYAVSLPTCSKHLCQNLLVDCKQQKELVYKDMPKQKKPMSRVTRNSSVSFLYCE